MQYLLVCFVGWPLHASADDPAQDPLWLWRFPALIELARQATTYEDLSIPDLVAVARRQMDWNLRHPLVGGPRDEPPYFHRVPVATAQSYVRSVERYLYVAGRGGDRALAKSIAAQDISLENSMRLVLESRNSDVLTYGIKAALDSKFGAAAKVALQTAVGTNDLERLKVAVGSAAYVAPFSAGDPKRTIGAWMSRGDGSIDRDAGKNWGNWQAGAIAYWSGAPTASADWAAGKVQFFQDMLYAMAAWREGRRPKFDHPLGDDDPQGIAYVEKGRAFARSREFEAVYRASSQLLRSNTFEPPHLLAPDTRSRPTSNGSPGGRDGGYAPREPLIRYDNGGSRPGHNRPGDGYGPGGEGEGPKEIRVPIEFEEPETVIGG